MQSDPLLRFRALTPADPPALRHWRHMALWEPLPAHSHPLDFFQFPGVSASAERWRRASDMGVVGVVSGEDTGACLIRLLPPHVGPAYVREATPPLGIALKPPYQRQGCGTPLMLCLSCHLMAAR